MRLSVQYRLPLADVMAWPESHLRLILAFSAKEPPPELRLEMAIAQLTALIFNQVRGKGEDARKASDFLICDDPWGTRPVVSDVDAALDRALRTL